MILFLLFEYFFSLIIFAGSEKHTNEQNIGRSVYRFEEHRNLYTRSRPNNDLTFPRLHTWRRWKSGNLIESLVQRQDEIGNWVSERIIRNEYELLSRTKLRNLSVTKTTFYPPSFVRIGSLSTTDLDDLILTPDLFERLENDLPLNQVQFDTLYGPSAEGYTDYPVFEQLEA